MGLLSFLRGDNIRVSVDRADEQRYLRPENELPLTGLFNPAALPPLQTLGIGDVYACVRVLADAASTLPLCVYRDTPQGRQDVTSGKLVDLLNRPSPANTQADLISTIVTHLVVWGNCFLAKYRDNTGAVAQIVPLYPDLVQPEIYNGNVTWWYTPPYSGNRQQLKAADVCHIRGMSVDNVIGLSPVTQAANVLGLSDALVKHALAYFDDWSKGGTARPAGVLNLGPDATAMQGGIEKEQLKNVSRPHGILVVSGEATYTPVAQKMDDSQFVEQRQLASNEVARVFRVPPHLIGAQTGDSLTYRNSEQWSLEFVRYSLMPWLRRIELAISNDPDLAFQNQGVRFDVDELLRGDAATRATYYTAALNPQTGWMTRAEVREQEGLEQEDTQPEAPQPPPVILPTTTLPDLTGAAINGNGSN